MAHHSNERLPGDLIERLRGQHNNPGRLGATGNFPLGKLTETDEGEIRMGISHMDGKVVMDFGKPTAWIGMTPDQAEDLARTITDNAFKARLSA